jgi:hypothetical protein
LEVLKLSYNEKKGETTEKKKERKSECEVEE